MMKEFCVDIDGVLCVDPEAAENDDGSRYRDFIRNARPLMLPRHRIGCLVTSRLEKYRFATEEWLDRHSVVYDRLIMMKYPNMRARQEAAEYSRFKARVYAESGARPFIESASHTAREVAELMDEPVFCFDTREMVYPGGYPRARHLPVRPPGPFKRAVRWSLRLLGRGIQKSRRVIGGFVG